MLKEFFSAFKGDMKPAAVLNDGREVIHKIIELLKIIEV